jgi:hypothetical protein
MGPCFRSSLSKDSMWIQYGVGAVGLPNSQGWRVTQVHNEDSVCECLLIYMPLEQSSVGIQLNP